MITLAYQNLAHDTDRKMLLKPSSCSFRLIQSEHRSLRYIELVLESFQKLKSHNSSHCMLPKGISFGCVLLQGFANPFPSFLKPGR